MARPTPLLASIPAFVPFVAPEEIERQRGWKFKLRLGANESSFGPSPRALEAAASVNPAYYGDPKSFLLRTALSEHHQVSINNLLVASGIDELLALFCRAFAAPGETVVTTDGTYPTFALGAMAAGNFVRRIPYRDHAPDLAALAEAAHDAKIVYLANPDNPTGSRLPPEAVIAFRQSLPESCLLLLDEAYSDFVPGGQLPTFSPNDSGVVRLRTFSKAHGLAGYRIGYALTNAEHIATLDKIRLHFGVNGPGQAAALGSLGDPNHLKKVVDQTNAGRTRLIEIATRCGFATFPSATNFVLFDTADRTDAILNALIDQRVFVRKAATGGLRVTIGQPHEIEGFEQALFNATA